MARCPECEVEIDLGDEIEEGQTLSCPECDAHLEVVSTNPLERDIVPNEEEEE